METLSMMPPSTHRVRLSVGWACALLLAGSAALASDGSAPDAKSAPMTVFAAASLTDVLPQIAAAWEAEGGPKVRFSFGATSKLVPQVIEGAPADLLVSADEAWMARLVDAGKAAAGSSISLARNRLVFVVPSGAASVPKSASDLPGALQKIALAGEAVPAGKYAKAALEAAQVWTAASRRIVRAEDVRLTLRWVSGGDADGGIVYRTDAKADPSVKVAFEFPENSHPPIVYPAAVVQGSARAADAARFLEFCRGAKARSLFERHGFLTEAR
jgi:molybdate transport system substrate-binding protein